MALLSLAFHTVSKSLLFLPKPTEENVAETEGSTKSSL